MIRVIRKPGYDKTGRKIEIGDFIVNYSWAVIVSNKTEKSYYFLFPSDVILKDIKSGKITNTRDIRKVSWRVRIDNTSKLTLVTPESFSTENKDVDIDKAMELRDLIIKLNE